MSFGPLAPQKSNYILEKERFLVVQKHVSSRMYTMQNQAHFILLLGNVMNILDQALLLLPQYLQLPSLQHQAHLS